MTQLNESPIITVERRKAVTIIISAVILSLALGGGLMKVGSGFASRSSDGITVTGSAKTTATADNAVWTLSVSLSSPTVAVAVKKVDADVEALSNYLTQGGISAESLTLGAVSTFANEEYSNGNSTGRILSYRASREVTVRSKDGFPFNLDVSQIIHIPTTEAPKVIARFGSMMNLVGQVLEPTIGNYFRNSAQDSDVIAFLSTRKERQDAAKSKISQVLDQYNVNGVDTLIGDIVPPESLMKTLTDRKIAEEQNTTFETQKRAEVTRQALEKETAVADMQKEIVKADQGVLISERIADAAVKKATGEAQSVKISSNAEADRLKVIAAADAEKTKLSANAEAEKVKMLANANAEKISVTGTAEAQSILAVGKSNAESYRLAVEAMGGDNFSRLKVTEAIGRDRIKVIPDVLITGGNGDGANGPISGLLGLKLLEEVSKNMGKNAEEKPHTDPDTKK